MSDEHDDDLEAEVDEGAEIETQSYASTAEDLDDRLSESDESVRADRDAGSLDDDDDDASDTI